MHIRKVAAAAGFACGAAMAFAPFAHADLDTTVASTLASEIALQNSIFASYASLADVDVTAGTNGGYDSLTNLATDAPQLVPNVATFGDVTPIESYIYGANPILAGIGGATGPFNEYNGALTEFYDAYNVYAYAAANNGALDTNVADYLGSTTTIGNAISGPDATVSSAAQYFYNFGMGDLKGYEGMFAPDSQGPGDILPTQAGEIAQLNSMFELDGKLANVFADIVPHTAVGTNVGFDSIDPTDLNSTFTNLVFGAAGASDDPGSFDVLNGALTEFFNADNVGLYALLNGGNVMPTDLIFGTHDFLGDGVTTAIGEYMNLGFQDLLGYFIPAAVASM